MKISKVGVILLGITALAFVGYFTFFSQKHESQQVLVKQTNENVVAHLTRLQNSVSYKANQEFGWKDATENLDLFKYDSIQTQEKAKAVVAYLSQSELNLNEKTLVIIDPSTMDKATSIDRAVLKKGYLLPKTKNEMWILTKNGLIKLKKSTKGLEGQLEVDEVNAKGIRLQLIEGEAQVIKLESSEAKSVEINKEIYLLEENKINLDDQNEINQIFKKELEKPTILETPIEKKETVVVKKTTPIVGRPVFKLKLTEPQNLSRGEVFETNKKSVLIAGFVEGDVAEILINGKKIEIGSKNQFNQEFDVKLGPQILIIQAFSKDGAVLNRKLVIIGHE